MVIKEDRNMGVGWISIILLGRLAVFAVAALCLGNYEANKLKKLLVRKLKKEGNRMTKFDICILIGACIVFVAALFAGLRYNKHLERKNHE